VEIYLIRHGQAGRRDDYDRLSVLGQEQVKLLSAYFASQGIQFDHVIAGGLRRQQETAALLSDNFETDRRWSEFDLDQVYKAVAPQLAERDERFRAEYLALEADSRDPNSEVHRTWKQSDRDVVMAWVSGSVPVAGRCETWADLAARVSQAWAELQQSTKHGRIAICTSATPIGITFSPDPAQAFARAGQLHNSSFTTWAAECQAFNQTPHLPEPRLLTLR
jgi:broad specificity phosphatase PhoE